MELFDPTMPLGKIKDYEMSIVWGCVCNMYGVLFKCATKCKP